MKRWCALAVICYLVPVALACCAAPPDNGGPIAAARGFVAALEARDASAIIALLEPSDWRGEIGPELRSYLGYLSALELREPIYQVTRNDGTVAQVRISGVLSYTLAESGASGERPVDLRVEMARVDAVWYLRSLDLPRP